MIRESFNHHWYFYKEINHKPVLISGPINLPHDAMLYETRDPKTRNGFNTGYFPGGTYRYMKTFFAPKEYQEKNLVIEFEGAYRDSEVYLNGQLAGGWPYGYTNFYVPIGQFIKVAQDNIIEVIVHNEKEPNSRWYSGSGIYRNVNLFVGNQVYIPPDGVRITTREIHDSQALVEVITTIVNNSQEAGRIDLKTEFRQMDGDISAVDGISAMVEAGGRTTIRRTISVPNAALWSVDYPNLYTCSSTLLDGENILDQNRETFGIRTLTLDPEKGLCINDQVIKLRGACVHHDNGVMGACTLEAAEERRVRLLKKSGFNALRSAHNPMSRAMLSACDRLGMLVMDEFSDVWYQSKTPHDYSLQFHHWWEKDLQAMVEKDYNHPCVVMYSIGNEITETATPEGVGISRRMAEKVRSLDDSRFVINCINGWLSYLFSFGWKLNKAKPDVTSNSANVDRKEKTIGLAINPIMNLANKMMDLIVSLPGIDRCTKDAYATVDVAGYNYMAGRYIRDGKLHPGRVICGSETFPPDIARNWRLVKKLPYVIGDFSWTGWDYLGEAGLCTWQYGGNQSLFKPYPCILADSSLIDITGHRQTQSYIHEIAWGLRKEPFIAVQPVNHSGEKPSKSVWRGTNAIDSWTWDGCEGKRAIVEVYADAPFVELFLNGRSLGKKPSGETRHFKSIFKTTYQPGELTALAYTQDGREIGRTTLITAGPHLQIHLDSEITQLRADGADLAFTHITLADEKRIVNPSGDRKVTVHVEGAGVLLGFGSANPFTQESFTDEVHTTYQGRALAVVRASLNPGTVTMTVSAEGCETRLLTIPVVEAAAPPAGQ